MEPILSWPHVDQQVFDRLVRIVVVVLHAKVHNVVATIHGDEEVAIDTGDGGLRLAIHGGLAQTDDADLAGNRVDELNADVVVLVVADDAGVGAEGAQEHITATNAEVVLDAHSQVVDIDFGVAELIESDRADESNVLRYVDGLPTFG